MLSWEDFSEFITHFTKPTATHSEHDILLSICGNGTLLAANPYGIARNSAPNVDSQKVVCFCEVPLHCLGRIASRRSRNGIGFRKTFARTRGAGPIWYVEKDSPQHFGIQNLMAAVSAPHLATQPIWSLTPFIDVPGEYPTGTYRFEWEREWRCVGNFTFTPDDVAFLVIPSELHIAARDFFRNARNENLGPLFGCPYIDSAWDAATVARALSEVWPHNH